MGKGSLDDPTVALKMRNYLDQMISLVVNKIRPLPQMGVVLTIRPGGAYFQTGNTVEGPPPAGPGNPAQVYYANVRLDNGEVVQARISENIPVVRQASWYDPVNPTGATETYLIADDQYRYTVSGSTNPDLTQRVTGLPVVPPRVMVEGQAGKYVVTRLIRGMVKFENAVLDSPLLINAATTAVKANGDFQTLGSSFTTNLQGWVGDTGWSIDNAGIEVDINHGISQSRYRFHAGEIGDADLNKWFLVPSYFETFQRDEPGLVSDLGLNVLLVMFPTRTSMHLYVCNRSITGFSTASDRYMGVNALVQVRSINGPLVQTGLSYPGSATDSVGSKVWKLTPSAYTVSDNYPHGRPGSKSVLQSDIENIKATLTGGGSVRASFVSSKLYLSWSLPFTLHSGRTIYRAGVTLFKVAMPAVGTNIPVVGYYSTDAGPQANRTVTSDGIDLTGWCSLYYVLPFGADDTSVLTTDAQWVIVRSGGFFSIPDNWVMIARTNADASTPDVTLLNGQEVDRWRDPVFGSGVDSLNSSHPLQYTLRNGVMYWRGIAVMSASKAIDSALFATTLPYVVRDQTSICVTAFYQRAAGDQSFRLDILGENGVSPGQVRPRLSLASGDQLMMDGICYPIN